MEREIGSGIGSWLKNAYKTFTNPTEALNRIPKAVQEFLDKYGGNTIAEIYICREPIKGAIKTALNVISSGEFGKKMEERDLKTMYHLFMVMKLDNGDLVLTERNERVVLKTLPSNFQIPAEHIKIRINVRLGSLFKAAIDTTADLFRYDPISNNCQKFIKTLLQNFHAYTPEVAKFVTQASEGLLSGNALRVAKATTDFASLASNIFKGGKKPSKPELHAYLSGCGLSGFKGLHKKHLHEIAGFLSN